MVQDIVVHWSFGYLYAGKYPAWFSDIAVVHSHLIIVGGNKYDKLHKQNGSKSHWYDHILSMSDWVLTCHVCGITNQLYSVHLSRTCPGCTVFLIASQQRFKRHWTVCKSSQVVLFELTPFSRQHTAFLPLSVRFPFISSCSFNDFSFLRRMLVL